jgi:hypothetical protein
LAGHEADVRRDGLSDRRFGLILEPQAKGLVDGGAHGNPLASGSFFKPDCQVIGKIDGSFHMDTVCRSGHYGNTENQLSVLKGSEVVVQGSELR